MIGTIRKAVINTKPGVIQRSARVPGQKYTQLTNRGADEQGGEEQPGPVGGEHDRRPHHDGVEQCQPRRLQPPPQAGARPIG